MRDDVSVGARFMLTEAAAICAAAERLGLNFDRAVNALRICRGKVVVVGIGKSGHVGRKIAATLSSTGTPAMFLHAAEASHGDLGTITAEDVVLFISNSGETAELLTLLPRLKGWGNKMLAIVGDMNSTIAKAAHIALDSGVDREACPLNLAPSASTAVQMALGDALACAAMAARGETADGFAWRHPGGELGKRLAA